MGRKDMFSAKGDMTNKFNGGKVIQGDDNSDGAMQSQIVERGNLEDAQMSAKACEGSGNGVNGVGAENCACCKSKGIICCKCAAANKIAAVVDDSKCPAGTVPTPPVPKRNSGRQYIGDDNRVSGQRQLVVTTAAARTTV